MEQVKEYPEYNEDLLTFKKAEKKDFPYIIKLARREIGVIPKRLRQHKNFLIYRDNRLIGFISYRRVGDHNLYIYMLAFEKDAQNKGNSFQAGRWMFIQESSIKPVYGIASRILKTNAQAIHSTRDKYNYKVIHESPRYYTFYKRFPVVE